MTPAGIAAWVSASRRAQGLAAKVEDEATLLQVAAMLIAATGRAENGDAHAVA